MFQTFSNQILRSLKKGDTIYINGSMHSSPSKLVVDEVIEDAITGIAYFEEEDSIPEYGELYEDDWNLIYDIDFVE